MNENVSTLVRLEDCMDEKQYAYYSLVCSRLTKDPAEKMEWYQKVQHGLQNTLGMCCLIAGYYEQAEYDAIHRMENRFVTAALEEGNVYALADYYFMNGSAYACVDMDEMTHSWNLSLGFYQSLPDCYWKHNLTFRPFYLNGVYPTKYYDEKQLDVDKFDGKFFSYYAYMQAVELSKLERSLGGTVEAVRIKKDELVREEAKVMKIRGSNMTRVAAAAPSANKVFDVVEEMPQFAGGSGSDAEQFLDQVQVRENLNETAFFYPALESDNLGNVAIRFTLPESVTTWKFMGLAHDKEMRNGLLVDEAVAQKTVMVQPNMPRFLRASLSRSRPAISVMDTSFSALSAMAICAAAVSAFTL